jgi:hypothetical protein
VQLKSSEASSSLVGNSCKTGLLTCVYELKASHSLESCMLEVWENWTTSCLHNTRLKVVWFLSGFCLFQAFEGVHTLDARKQRGVQ